MDDERLMTAAVVMLVIALLFQRKATAAPAGTVTSTITYGEEVGGGGPTVADRAPIWDEFYEFAEWGF